MTPADLPAVERIEALSIPQPWPIAEHARELASNPNAVYVVACGTRAAGASGRGCSGVVGFAGMWIHADEAHITKLAVHPGVRRRRIGERLLLELIRCAELRGAADITLEVRVSNLAAFRLYARNGFAEVGRRRGYYPDTGEDAILMTRLPSGASLPRASETKSPDREVRRLRAKEEKEVPQR